MSVLGDVVHGFPQILKGVENQMWVGTSVSAAQQSSLPARVKGAGPVAGFLVWHRPPCLGLFLTEWKSVTWDVTSSALVLVCHKAAGTIQGPLGLFPGSRQTGFFGSL